MMVKTIMIEHAEIAYKQSDNESQPALNMDYEEYKKYLSRFIVIGFSFYFFFSQSGSLDF